MRIRLFFSLRTSPRVRKLAELLGGATPGSPYVTCPECGTARVKRLATKDQIDRVSQAPWSGLQRFFGGRLYRCAHCRLQFYDCRKRPHRSEGTADLSAGGIDLVS